MQTTSTAATNNSCRLWVPVAPTEFYLPVTSLLAAPQMHALPSSTGAVTGGSAAAVDGEGGGDDDLYGSGPPSARRMLTAGGENDNVDLELEEDEDEEGGGGSGGSAGGAAGAAGGGGYAGDSASGGWVGMRTVAELRRAHNVPVPVNKDSLYGQTIDRTKRVFNPIPVPKSVEASLPYASKSKNVKAKSKGGKEGGYLANRAVALEPSERKRLAFLNTLGTIRNEKKAVRKVADNKRREEKVKQKRKIEETFALSQKATKKKEYRTKGLEVRAKLAKKH